jgi:hypothetical protein
MDLFRFGPRLPGIWDLGGLYGVESEDAFCPCCLVGLRIRADITSGSSYVRWNRCGAALPGLDAARRNTVKEDAEDYPATYLLYVFLAFAGIAVGAATVAFLIL